MIRERKRADGSTAYLVRVKYGGKTYNVGTFDSPKAAREAEQDFGTERRKVERGELPEHHDSRRTFNEVADAFLKSREKPAKFWRSRKPHMFRLRSHVRPVLGKTSITDITPAMITGLRNELAGKVSGRMANAVVSTTSAVFTFAVKSKWVSSNPCREVSSVEIKPDEFNWIRTTAEIEMLLSVCKPELRDMIALAIGTGMRSGELRNLHWSDIDLGRRLITVQRGDNGTTKANKHRRIPILDPVLPLLRRRRLSRGGRELVFANRVGRVVAASTVQQRFKAALRLAGLDVSLRWHDLRHTHAAHWVSNGGDIFRLSKALGHSSVRVTESIYAHLRPDAWEADYDRVTFNVPGDEDNVVHLDRVPRLSTTVQAEARNAL